MGFEGVPARRYGETSFEIPFLDERKIKVGDVKELLTLIQTARAKIADNLRKSLPPHQKAGVYRHAVSEQNRHRNELLQKIREAQPHGFLPENLEGSEWSLLAQLQDFIITEVMNFLGVKADFRLKIYTTNGLNGVLNDEFGHVIVVLRPGEEGDTDHPTLVVPLWRETLKKQIADRYEGEWNVKKKIILYEPWENNGEYQKRTTAASMLDEIRKVGIKTMAMKVAEVIQSKIESLPDDQKMFFFRK